MMKLTFQVWYFLLLEDDNFDMEHGSNVDFVKTVITNLMKKMSEYYCFLPGLLQM